MQKHLILIDGLWREADAEEWFSPFNPTTGNPLEEKFPVSSWQDCETALDAAQKAYEELKTQPDSKRAEFLEAYATAIEANVHEIAEIAHLETGLAVQPRLTQVELPRTTMQLREAAKAASENQWRNITIDTTNNIRSWLEPVGPVVVFGPNNFPFAFGSASGGDFAAAIAAGNPVIAKAHPAHPGTTRLFAELAQKAAESVGLPRATVQLIYAVAPSNGLRLVSDPRIGATAFTGSKNAGLALKKAADEAGKLIYLEMSSLNPVIILKGALAESSDEIAEAFTASCTMAAGQLCTKPGLLFVPNGEQGDVFVSKLKKHFNEAPIATLLSPEASNNIAMISRELVRMGAQRETESTPQDTERFCGSNQLLSVEGEQFIENHDTFQSEMFGNASLVVRFQDAYQVVKMLARLEGNLTGCIYSHSGDADDADYWAIEPVLKEKVGRLLNDKMPTGVLVSPAMNHGGPFPATGHPGYTAVGMPAALQRFAALKCYDDVRSSRLPELLQDQPGQSSVWRQVDGKYSQAPIEKN